MMRMRLWGVITLVACLVVFAVATATAYDPPFTYTSIPRIMGPPSPPDYVAPDDVVVIGPGSNAQGIIDSHPAGTTFLFASGVHSAQTIKPRNGDTFIGESGAVLDGKNGVEYAFRSGASSVTIRDLVIENYSNAPQTGAIDSIGSGWKIINNEIRYNRGGGISFGNNYQVKGNYVHHNHQIGIVGQGDNALIAGNEIAYNNYQNEYDPDWEAGGTKFVKTVNLVVRDNHVHNNHGNGLWTDFDNYNTVYENNVVENNQVNGIFHEISYDAVIRNNTVRNNGKRQIRVTSSPNVEIHNNVVVAGGGSSGIYGADSDRGSGARGTFEIRNLWVHHNKITTNSGYTGLRDNKGTGAVWNNNNRFDHNTYTANTSQPFFWQNDERTAAEWQGYGNDTNGTIN